MIVSPRVERKLLQPNVVDVTDVDNCRETTTVTYSGTMLLAEMHLSIIAGTSRDPDGAQNIYRFICTKHVQQVVDVTLIFTSTWLVCSE